MAQQSAGMPYIGSLISLISKTGVRYEGTLYTIDMVESTIALQNGTAQPTTAAATSTGPLQASTNVLCLQYIPSAPRGGSKKAHKFLPARGLSSSLSSEVTALKHHDLTAHGHVDRSRIFRPPTTLFASAGTDIADLTVITNGPPEGQQVT